MSKTATSTANKKSYTRKCVPRCDTLVYDTIVTSNKNGKNSASSAAVSVSRWGQTTFTSVRRQRELNGTTNSGGNNTGSIFKHERSRLNEQQEPQVDSFSKHVSVNEQGNVQQASSAVTPSPVKPKTYKFFKSKSSSSSPQSLASNNSVIGKNEKKLKEIVLNEEVRKERNEQFIKHVKIEHESEHAVGRRKVASVETVQAKQVNVQPLRCNNAKLKVNEQRKIEVVEREHCDNTQQSDVNKASTIMTRLTRSRMKEQNERYCEKTFDEIIASSIPSDRVKKEKKVVNAKGNLEEKQMESVKMDEDEEKEEEEQEDVIESIRKSVKKYEARKVLEEKAKEVKAKGKKMKGTEETFDEIVNERLNEPSDAAGDVHMKSVDNNLSSKSSITYSSQPIQHVISIDNSCSSSSSSQPEPLPSATNKETATATTNKPKRRIFSLSKSSRSVKATAFNTRNFYSGESAIDETDEHGSKVMSSQGGASTSSSGASKQAGGGTNFGFDDEKDYESDDYVKLKRVKKANQCHDLGESEQFDGDIKFYLSGIESSNAIPMRCLSILGLSQQTMRPEFRLHLRAHDDMPKIINALMDAPTDPNLALCTATWLFCYNQGGRLNMDINAEALHLMLQLLETRSDECHQVEQKHREKVRGLCEEMKKSGNAQYLNLNEITAGKLTMETLLGLTSKRANRDSIKDELRKLKGIDFILNTAMRCADFYFDEGRMIKIDRCMHVLENVTLDNTENQMYILTHENGQFIETCIKLLNSSKVNIMQNKHKVYSSMFFSILRVLTHLTSEITSLIEHYNHLMILLLDSLFDLPQFIPLDQRFDFHIILLCLAINLVEFYPELRSLVIKNSDRLDKLIGLLTSRIEEAQKTEQQADELLESHEAKLIQMNEATRDSILEQILAKSGKHMEHSIIAACVSLLLGCCIHDNFAYSETLREHCPNSSFDQLVDVLQKFRDFAHLADIMTVKGKERVERIIEVFKSEENKFKASSGIS